MPTSYVYTLDPWFVSESFIDVSAHPTWECTHIHTHTHRSMLHTVSFVTYSVVCTMTIRPSCVICDYDVVGVVSRVVSVGIVGTIICSVWITEGLASLFAGSNGTNMSNDGNQFLISVLLEKSGFQQHDLTRSRRRNITYP